MARASYSTTPLLRSLVHHPQGVILVFSRSETVNNRLHSLSMKTECVNFIDVWQKLDICQFGGLLRDALHYKNQDNTTNQCKPIQYNTTNTIKKISNKSNTHQLCSKRSEPCSFRLLLMTPVQFCTWDPLQSFEVKLWRHEVNIRFCL